MTLRLNIRHSARDPGFVQIGIPAWLFPFQCLPRFAVIFPKPICTDPGRCLAGATSPGLNVAQFPARWPPDPFTRPLWAGTRRARATHIFACPGVFRTSMPRTGTPRPVRRTCRCAASGLTAVRARARLGVFPGQPACFIRFLGGAVRLLGAFAPDAASPHPLRSRHFAGHQLFPPRSLFVHSWGFCVHTHPPITTWCICHLPLSHYNPDYNFLLDIHYTITLPCL